MTVQRGKQQAREQSRPTPGEGVHSTPGEILRSLAFDLIFYGGTVLGLLTLPLVLTLTPGRLRGFVAGWCGWQRWCLRNLLGITIRIEGERPGGGVLVALKHESMFEAIDLPLLLQQPVIFAKVELLRLPLWGWAANRYGVVPVERDQGAKALRAMVAAAKRFADSGRPLAIFPEGTRVAPGRSPRLQSGFAGIYKLIGLPVVPVAIESGHLLHRRWKRSGTIRIRFGETIPAGLPREEIEARVHAAINLLNRGEPA